jgi:hypothetical protein
VDALSPLKLLSPLHVVDLGGPGFDVLVGGANCYGILLACGGLLQRL